MVDAGGRQIGGEVLPAERQAGEPESPILLVVLLALLVRLAVALPQLPADPGSGWTFEQYGLRIAAGHGFGPSSHLPPLYAYYLAMLYRVYGYSPHPIVLSQALIAALALIPVMLMTQAAGLRRSGMYAAGLVVALFPQAAAEVRHLTPQVLVSALFVTGAWLWLRSERLPGKLETVGAGLLLGLAVLARMGVLLPAAALLLTRRAWLFREHPESWTRFESVGITVGAHRPPRAELWLRRSLLVIAMGAAVAPWVARNTALHHRPAFVETTWALRLRAVTVPGTPAFRFQPPGQPGHAPDNLVLTDNVLALQETVGYILARPGEWLGTVARRLSRFLSFSPSSDISPQARFPYRDPWFRLLQIAVLGTLLSLTAAWWILGRAPGSLERTCAWTALGFCGLAVTVGGTGDGRLFALPFLAVTAGRGFEVLAEWRPGRFSRSPAGSLRRGLYLAVILLIWTHGLWAAGVGP